MSQIQIGSTQSCMEEWAGHDTDHILHSHQAKTISIATHHNKGYKYPLKKDSVSSEFSSKHCLHQLLLQEVRSLLTHIYT